MSLREDLLTKLQSSAFDLLIIGGGIIGAGIARDAAMRGLKVALIEQGDFASGTSSKTSKLIHGGLRYLEHGRLRLVFESLRERRILRRIAPGLVAALSLLLPIYERDPRPAWKIHAGLWLYDALAIGRNLRRHQMRSARGALALEPALNSDGLRAAGLYADCQMDDARLCLANVLQAIGFGAVCVNYVRLRAFLKINGHLCGAAAENVLAGRSLEIQAKIVINAAGPWADRVRRMSDGMAAMRLAPTKGIHVVLPPIIRQALFAQARADGRMLFLMPWSGYTLVGTTETPVRESLDALAAESDDVAYLLAEVNRIIPGSRLTERDIVSTFAGARPLLGFAGTSTQASREHRIEVDRWGLVSVMGGKFTTYRLIAQHAVDLVLRQQRWRADRCFTDHVSVLEATAPLALEGWRAVTRTIDPERLARLLVRYGAAAMHILALLDREPTLSAPLCPHHDDLAAELAHAIQRELACTITDVLARRTRVAWSSCQGLDALSTVVEIFQRHGGLSAEQVHRQVEEYRCFLARGIAFRSASTLAAPTSIGKGIRK